MSKIVRTDPAVPAARPTSGLTRRRVLEGTAAVGLAAAVGPGLLARRTAAAEAPASGATQVAAHEVPMALAGNIENARLMVFARPQGETHDIAHIEQVAPNGDWSRARWRPVGVAYDEFCAHPDVGGRVVVVGSAADDDISFVSESHERATSKFSKPRSLGGGTFGDLAVARNADGRMEVFAVGPDHGLWHNWETSPAHVPSATEWSGWHALGGTASGLHADEQADGRLVVFARGGDSRLYRIEQRAAKAGRWSPWTLMGGGVAAADSALDGHGALHVLALGTDGRVWTRAQTAPLSGQWSDWALVAGGLEGARQVRLTLQASGLPLAVAHTGKSVFVSAMGNGAAEGAAPAYRWGAWEHVLDAGGIGAVDASWNADGRVSVFALVGGHVVLAATQAEPDGGGWVRQGKDLGGRYDRFVVVRDLSVLAEA